MNKAVLLLAAAACLAGCADKQKPEPRQSAMSETQSVATEVAAEDESAMAKDCPVIDSRGWSAWLNKMPSVDGGARLNIAGEVDLPTPGFGVEWVAGPADRANPPGQRFTLVLTPPDGIVAQVVTPTLVKYEDAAAYPAYRAIRVVCGGEVLAEITDIPDVQ